MSNSIRVSILFNILVIVIMTFALRSTNNMISTTMPLLAKYYFNFSGIEIGLLATTFMGATFIMSNFINAKLISKKRRVVFILSSFLYALIFPFFYLATSITIWILAFLGGFVLGALMPNIMTSAGLSEDRKLRERMLAIYTLSLSVSLLIGPAIESFILDYYTIKETFLFFVLIVILIPILSFSIKFPEESKDDVKRDFLTIWRNNGFKVAFFNNLTYSLPFSLIVTFAGIYGKEFFSLNNSQAIMIYTSFFMTSFLSRLLLAIKPAKNIKMLIEVSVIFTVLGLIFSFLSFNAYLFVISLLILGIPHGFTYTLSVISLSRSFDQKTRNAANSYFFSISTIIGSILPSILGFIVDFAGIRYTFLILVPEVIAIFILVEYYNKNGEKDSL